MSKRKRRERGRLRAEEEAEYDAAYACPAGEDCFNGMSTGTVPTQEGFAMFQNMTGATKTYPSGAVAYGVGASDPYYYITNPAHKW